MHEVGILCLGTKCPKASGSLIYTTGRQALSGAKAIATRTLPLCTQDHMAALLPQGRRNRGARGSIASLSKFWQMSQTYLNLGGPISPAPQILSPSYGPDLPHVYFP